MITVPEATKKIVERSRYLSEAISKGIINYSALSRYIKPELEEMLMKKISDSSIIMSLTRLEDEFRPKYVSSNIFQAPPGIVVYSGLCFISMSNKEISSFSLLLLKNTNPKSFVLRSQGVYESSFVLSRDIMEMYKNTIDSKTSERKENVSAVTIELPNEALQTSGIYYFFIKSLAWEGVNVLEIISSFHELTFIVEDRDAERTFGIIKSLFTNP